MYFKNLEIKNEKCNILEIRKKLPSAIFQLLGVFKSDRPVCKHLNVNFIKKKKKKTTLKTIFSLKKYDVCMFYQKKL